ncbi:MAG: guanylate kinase [Synergistaceae bacterium]|jgi:guanylate kinase|nr:guanylate kinase [Synergistaceae bacterium]
MPRGNLFILSGPAGAGKGTLRKMLFREMPDLVFSVSCTTRERRTGETDGKDYYYISRDDFGRMITRGEFLEWADVHGNYYGTRKSDVERVLGEGRDILLEIDVQGCRLVKSRKPDAIRIFITAPSLDELEDRLEERGTESRAQLDVRLRNAAMEMRHAREYDHIIVNDAISRAGGELIETVKRYREPEQN